MISLDKTSEISLNSAIKEAMKITGALKETDLGIYITHEGVHLSTEKFMGLKESDPQTLTRLLNESILENAQRFMSTEEATSDTKNIINSDLESVIENAMKKLNTAKEYDMCFYIPYQNSRLHHFTYAQLKKNNPESLLSLIQENILNRTPLKISRANKKRVKAAQNESVIESTDEDLQQVIDQAMKRRKLKISQESDLCKYLPNEEGGILFYSTFRSLKKNDPETLREMIHTHILSPRAPTLLPPNKRKHEDQSPQIDQLVEELPSNESRIDQVLEKTAQSMEMMTRVLESLHKFVPTVEDKSPSSSISVEKVLRTIQNQLISKVRQKQIDFELWETFVDLVQGNH